MYVPRQEGGAAVVNVAELVTRSKSGTVTQAELNEVARMIEAGAPDRALYDLIYILGRSFSYDHEPLIARYLDYPADPWVARCALEVLCRMWDRQETYSADLRRFLVGVAWDEGEVRQIAISAAGAYLKDHVDTEMLSLIVRRANLQNESQLEREVATESLAVALGSSTSEIVLRDRSEPWDEWAAKVVQRARLRLDSEGGSYNFE